MMLEIFRLIRIYKLLFVAFTMYAMRYFVLKPILHINDLSLQMSDTSFSLLVISVSCLLAGANIINDYFDTKADRISGIRKIIVGKHISRRAAMSLHTLLNIVAVGIAFYLSIAVGVWKIGILFLLVSGLLWFYSSTYKRRFLLGNLLVAFAFALVPISVILYEIPLLNVVYADLLIVTDTNFLYLFRWILGFSYFLFLTTLIYEINKDIYSFEGDADNRINTLPVRLGVKTTKQILIGLSCIAIGSVCLFYFTVFTGSCCVGIYFSIAIILPYLIYIFLILSKSEKRKLQIGMLRLILVLGICFSFLLNHFFQTIFVE